MNVKKFLEPSRRKLIIFSAVFLLFEILYQLIVVKYLVSSTIVPGGEVLPGLIQLIKMPFWYIIYKNIYVTSLVWILSPIIQLLDLFWIYFVASLIDSRLKK